MHIHLRPPTTPTIEEEIFASLLQANPNTEAREARKKSWILEDTQRTVNIIVYMHQYPMHDQGLL